MTAEEVRQALLSELEAGQQAIAELSDEELEAITGRGGCVSCQKAPDEGQPVHIGELGNYSSKGRKAVYLAMRDVGKDPITSAYKAIKYGPRTGERFSKMDIHYTSVMRQMIRQQHQEK